ncbi:MAG: PilT/PilU family type 4a pilus ATPase [Verrucomicrobiota bacterium]|nr:PilT/PilU family type 4a pilus ATPase [Verrucomicrobiota bacterium]
MRKAELDVILNTILDTYPEVSDINFTCNKPMQAEVSGQLLPVPVNPPIDRLTPFQTESLAMNLINASKRLTEDLIRNGSCDSSYALGDRARFRVNIFSQRKNYSIVMRRLQTVIPSIEQLNLPEVFWEIIKEKTGLILVTGATGSGKTTTLAAVLDAINSTKPIHVVTLEDPVEFVHPQKTATFNQRELGDDFVNFAGGLRAALRQAPKVILVGEMRDRETVEIGMSAAETGHLVLSTLHTIDAGQTVNRLVGMFEQEEQKQVRMRLADTLRYVISQRLVPKVPGGRQLIMEIMGANLRTKESIMQGETEGKTFYEIIEASSTFGWRNFDMSLTTAFEQGTITEDTAKIYSTRKAIISRNIDNIKKTRGENVSKVSGLKLEKNS